MLSATSARPEATGHRWLAALASFDFGIKYRPGSSNTDADALSRLPGWRQEQNAGGGSEDRSTSRRSLSRQSVTRPKLSRMWNVWHCLSRLSRIVLTCKSNLYKDRLTCPQFILFTPLECTRTRACEWVYVCVCVCVCVTVVSWILFQVFTCLVIICSTCLVV